MRRLMNNASNKSDCIQLITGETAKELLSDAEEDEDDEEEETDSEQSPGETFGAGHHTVPTENLQVPIPCGGSPRRARVRRRPRLTWSTTAVTGTTKATATAANTAAAASKGGSSLLSVETAAATATFGTIMVTNRPQQLRDPSPMVVRAYATAEQQLPPPTGSAGVGPSTIHPPNNAPTPEQQQKIEHRMKSHEANTTQVVQQLNTLMTQNDEYHLKVLEGIEAPPEPAAYCC
ncbi:hypothetical protein SELMODRAFT_427128 [Selaginella moellendorffii]|uniref:Uncharacterized protein n=1 Tax=Selaginella moellendorffii TaxID=88036 RepID=D8SYL2_SELML|nr:hypothetical protein SELMODRAFT_427128 [Selaginella moellendorffii]